MPQMNTVGRKKHLHFAVTGVLLVSHQIDSYSGGFNSNFGFGNRISTRLFEGQDDGFTLEGFNPFESNASRGLGVGPQVSARQMSMKQLINEVLCVIDSKESIQEVLQTNRSFLMEPFDNLEGFLESDSIYNSSMDRQERLEHFSCVMEERIKQAKNNSVKMVLQSIKDFVITEAS